MKRAQLFSMELIIVISIFLILTTTSVILWNNYVQDSERFQLQKSLQTKAFSAADFLIKSELATQPNEISFQKTNDFLNLGYEDARYALAIQPHDFFMKVSCINNTYEENPDQSVSGFQVSELVNDRSGPPDITLQKNATPSAVYLGDTVKINLSAMGVGISEIKYPVDVVLIMDRSGSMQGQKMTDAKESAKEFVDKLNSSIDRASLVSFTYGGLFCDWFGSGCYARLDQELTFNLPDVKNSIDSLTTSGYTAIGEGIKTANEEFVSNGRTDVPRVSVLLSDGQNNRGDDPVQQAEIAADNNIKIYTIGLGDDANQTLMQQIADLTGGKYYFAPNSSDLDRIYSRIAKEITDIAGKNITVTDYLHPGVTPIEPLPENCISTELPSGATAVKCVISENINIDEVISVVFDVRVNNATVDSTNMFSFVNYTDYKNMEKSKFFVDPLLIVLAPNYCAQFSEKTFGVTPPPGAEVVATKRIGQVSDGIIFVELYVWEDRNV